MIIEIKIHPSLHSNVLETDKLLDGDKWEIADNATVGQILNRLNIPEKEATLLLVNGRAANKNHRLNEGDVFAVFPLLSGG